MLRFIALATEMESVEGVIGYHGSDPCGVAVEAADPRLWGVYWEHLLEFLDVLREKQAMMSHSTLEEVLDVGE